MCHQMTFPSQSFINLHKEVFVSFSESMSNEWGAHTHTKKLRTLRELWTKIIRTCYHLEDLPPPMHLTSTVPQFWPWTKNCLYEINFIIPFCWVLSVSNSSCVYRLYVLYACIVYVCLLFLNSFLKSCWIIIIDFVIALMSMSVLRVENEIIQQLQTLL